MVWSGLVPQSFVGVVIALIVLLPESVAALRAALRGEMQTSLNLSLGSALAEHRAHHSGHRVSLSIWLDGPITLGSARRRSCSSGAADPASACLPSGLCATVLQGAQHLAVFVAFVFLATAPATVQPGPAMCPLTHWRGSNNGG